MAIFTGSGKKKAAGIESGPPVWTYIVSIIVLAVLVFALYSCL